MAGQINITDADRAAGAGSATAFLNQRIVDLEAVIAAMRRTIMEREVADAAQSKDQPKVVPFDAKSDKPGKG